jgi:hypothetical protein
MPNIGHRAIRVEGAGVTLHWSIIPTGERWLLNVWDTTHPQPVQYVGTLEDMRRIAASQGAR